MPTMSLQLLLVDLAASFPFWQFLLHRLIYCFSLRCTAIDLVLISMAFVDTFLRYFIVIELYANPCLNCTPWNKVSFDRYHSIRASYQLATKNLWVWNSVLWLCYKQ